MLSIGMKRAVVAGAALVLSIGLGGVACAATLFTNATGLSGSHSTVTFDELSFPDRTSITNQYTPYGVTLNNGFINVQDIALPRNYISNYSVSGINPDLVITFNQTVTDTAFQLATNSGLSSFQAFLGATLVGSGSLSTSIAPAFFGFTGGSFDRIRIVAPGNLALQIKNVQFASAVPEPATWAMMIIGFGGVGSMVRTSRRRNAFSAV